MMQRLTVFSLAALLVAHGARAELEYPTHVNADYTVGGSNQYECVNGEAVRMIYVAHKDNVGQVPCAVIYKKLPPEKPSLETPWHAETDGKFCETKAKLLADRLRQAGWKCSTTRPNSGNN